MYQRFSVFPVLESPLGWRRCRQACRGCPAESNGAFRVEIERRKRCQIHFGVTPCSSSGRSPSQAAGPGVGDASNLLRTIFAFPVFVGSIDCWRCQQACRRDQAESNGASRVEIERRKVAETQKTQGDVLPSDTSLPRPTDQAPNGGGRGFVFRVLFENVDRRVKMDIFLLPLPSQFQRCLWFFDRSSGTFFDL